MDSLPPIPSSKGGIESSARTWVNHHDTKSSGSKANLNGLHTIHAICFKDICDLTFWLLSFKHLWWLTWDFTIKITLSTFSNSLFQRCFFPRSLVQTLHTIAIQCKHLHPVGSSRRLTPGVIATAVTVAMAAMVAEALPLESSWKTDESSGSAQIGERSSLSRPWKAGGWAIRPYLNCPKCIELSNVWLNFTLFTRQIRNFLKSPALQADDRLTMAYPKQIDSSNMHFLKKTLIFLLCPWGTTTYGARTWHLQEFCMNWKRQPNSLSHFSTHVAPLNHQFQDDFQWFQKWYISPKQS